MSPAWAMPETGRAAARRSRDRRRRRPGARSRSLTADGRSRALPWPRAPARASPARRPHAPPPPPPPGLHCLRCPTGCRTRPDRAPNAAAQSPSLLFGPPSTIKRRPDWRRREGALQSERPSGWEPFGRVPAQRARGSQAAARARMTGLAQRNAAGWVEAPRSPSLFFCQRGVALRKAVGRHAGSRRLAGPEARRSGRRGGRGGGKRPEGGPALGGNRRRVVLGRGRERAGARAKFEIVQNSGVVTVLTAVFWRARPGPGVLRSCRRRGGESTWRAPRGVFCRAGRLLAADTTGQRKLVRFLSVPGGFG